MTGHCLDKDSNPRLLVRGHWDEYVEYAPVTSNEGKITVAGDFKELWRVQPRPYVNSTLVQQI